MRNFIDLEHVSIIDEPQKSILSMNPKNQLGDDPHHSVVSAVKNCSALSMKLPENLECNIKVEEVSEGD